jgi:hypothetical protein
MDERSATDQFELWDGAYVLGALSPAERDAYEEHLVDCAACRARVAEIGSLPLLLADLSLDDVTAESDAGPLPETLLPRLMRAADSRRRRTRVLFGALASVAAACIATLVVVLWPGGRNSGHTPPEAAGWVTMHAPGASPLQASVRLVAKDSGTEVDLRCRYDDMKDDKSPPYGLIAYNRANQAEDIGWWSVPAGAERTYRNNSSFAANDIARVEIVLRDQKAVLYRNF